MELSPYTQYYVRRLLRQYVTYLNYPLSGVSVCAYFQTSLDQLLKQLYPKGFEFRIKMQELETLVRLHQSSDLNKIYPYQNLAEIEQKILYILGLKFLVLLAKLSLTIVPESVVSLFHFVLDERIHQGIRYSDELYGKLLEFHAKYDPKASQLLSTLLERQIPFVLTVSEYRHSIWVSLRSPTYYSLCQQNTPLLEKIA
jgi:hypothetical protein